MKKKKNLDEKVSRYQNYLNIGVLALLLGERKLDL